MKLSAIKWSLFGLITALICFAELATAQVATVSELSGNVQVAAPAAAGGASRILRKGDSVNQGDTLTTGDASSVVIRFTDGQVAALASRSRLVITTYVYSPTEPAKSNVFFSLLQGGMRAVTGLIGRSRPQAVNYRAASATIGIRGTDVSIGVDGGVVAVVVSEGMISFTFGGQTVTIPSGQGAVTVGDMIQTFTAAQIIDAITAQGTPPALTVAAALKDLKPAALEDAIKQALTPGGSTGSAAPASTPEPSGPTNTTGGGSSSKG